MNKDKQVVDLKANTMFLVANNSHRFILRLVSIILSIGAKRQGKEQDIDFYNKVVQLKRKNLFRVHKLTNRLYLYQATQETD